MPATWKLIIEDDAGKQIVVPFTREIITIGRKEGNTIRLTERNVSRNHAKLSKENGHVVIEDLKSFNGIKLNGDRIDGRVLVHEGDTIQIGDYHLALHAQDGAGQGQGHANGSATENLKKDSGEASPTQADDDEFAGDTQRWEPPPGVPALQVGGLATTEDRAVSDEHTAPAPIVTVRTLESAASGGFGADSGDTERVTMDMLAPLSQNRGLPTRARDAELEPTVRQATSPAAISMPPSSPPVAQPPPPSPPLGAVPHVGNAAPAEFFGETRPEARLPERPVDRPLDRTPSMPQPHPPPPAPAPQAPQAREPATPQAPPRTPALEARGVVEEQTEAMRAAPGGDDVLVPRLVVLNTIFAGSTFSLRAAEAVIGRTEDNDITIEHKSVSRNHAKVVREGDRVRILDLKSANGVLVNNEEVEAAVLRSGDVVELGRVRMRFVPIGERFSVPADEIERARIADAAGDDFESDAGTGVTNPVRKKQQGGGGIAPISASYPAVSTGGRPAWVYAAVGAVIVLVLVVIAIFATRGGEEKKVENPTPPVPVPVVVARNDPPVPVTPPATPPPPVEDAKPPVEDAKPPVEDAKPPADDVKAEETKHTTTTKSAPKKASLQDSLRTAKQALLQKDASAAVEALAPFDRSDNADVHRLLGVAYAQEKKNALASKHYREYLRLKPDAPDAEQVRGILAGGK